MRLSFYLAATISALAAHHYQMAKAVQLTSIDEDHHFIAMEVFSQLNAKGGLNQSPSDINSAIKGSGQTSTGTVDVESSSATIDAIKKAEEAKNNAESDADAAAKACKESNSAHAVKVSDATKDLEDAKKAHSEAEQAKKIAALKKE